MNPGPNRPGPKHKSKRPRLPFRRDTNKPAPKDRDKPPPKKKTTNPGTGGTTTTTTTGTAISSQQAEGSAQSVPMLTSATTTAPVTAGQSDAADQQDSALQSFYSTGTGPAYHYHPAGQAGDSENDGDSDDA